MGMMGGGEREEGVGLWGRSRVGCLSGETCVLR